MAVGEYCINFITLILGTAGTSIAVNAIFSSLLCKGFFWRKSSPAQGMQNLIESIELIDQQFSRTTWLKGIGFWCGKVEAVHAKPCKSFSIDWTELKLLQYFLVVGLNPAQLFPWILLDLSTSGNSIELRYYMLQNDEHNFSFRVFIHLLHFKSMSLFVA